MYKFNFEIDIQDYIYDNDSICWKGFDVITTYGNSLEELLENAEIFLSDQDGGEAGSFELGETSHYELFETLITAEYEKIEKLYSISFKVDGHKGSFGTQVTANTDLEAVAEAFEICSRHAKKTDHILDARPTEIKVLDTVKKVKKYMEKHGSY